MTNTYADILDQMDKRKIKKSKKGLEEWGLYEQKLTASNLLVIDLKIPLMYASTLEYDMHLV